MAVAVEPLPDVPATWTIGVAVSGFAELDEHLAQAVEPVLGALAERRQVRRGRVSHSERVGPHDGIAIAAQGGGIDGHRICS